MSQFSFEFPYAFLLLPLFIFCIIKCPAKSLSIYLPYINVLIGKKSLKSRWLDFVKWGAVVSIIVALASPVLVTEYRNIKKEGRDIMLIIDSSQSMLEKGFDIDNPTRDKFSAVTDVVDSFIKDRVDDRIGLVNFASSVFIASPLTFDKNYLLDILHKQKVGIAGKRTAIYDALLQGLYMIQKSEAKSKTVILLTDGIDNMSSIKFTDIVSFVKRVGVKLYTIGIGSNKDLEVPKLKALANASGGKFFMATNNAALKKIYKEIDSSETSAIKSTSYKVYKYYYYFPLMMAIILLLIFVYFKSVRGVAK